MCSAVFISCPHCKAPRRCTACEYCHDARRMAAPCLARAGCMCSAHTGTWILPTHSVLCMAAQLCLADTCHISLKILPCTSACISYAQEKLASARRCAKQMVSCPQHTPCFLVYISLQKAHHFMHKTVKVSWMLMLHSWHGKRIRRDMQLTPDAVKMQTPTMAELLPQFCRSFHSLLSWLHGLKRSRTIHHFSIQHSAFQHTMCVLHHTFVFV
jgi:hypothetical protein